MNISQKGIDLIASFEGCKLTAYQDVVGVWTIGYGHTADVKRGQTITQTQAKELLKQDVSYFVNGVNSAINKKIISFDVNQNQFDALVSFAYNLGVARITNLCKGRNASQVADAFMLYNKASGRVIAGLTNRRKKEQELFLTPVSGGSSKSTTTKTSSNKTSTSSTKCPYKKAAKNRTFKKGSNGESVKWIQWQLNKKNKAGLTVDGDYGDKTVSAVKSFQKSKKLTVDGICGPKTIEKLAE